MWYEDDWQIDSCLVADQGGKISIALISAPLTGLQFILITEPRFCNWLTVIFIRGTPIEQRHTNWEWHVSHDARMKKSWAQYRAPTLFEIENSLLFQDFFQAKISFFKTMSIHDKWKITIIRWLFSTPFMFNVKFGIPIWKAVGGGRRGCTHSLWTNHAIRKLNFKKKKD